MTALDQAFAVYDLEPCARPFEEDLRAHLIGGIVHSTPTAFVLARYVCRSWPAAMIVDPWENDVTCDPRDCLHVYLAAGDMREIFTFSHTPCKWISFERSNTLKFYDYARFRRSILHA